MAVKTVKRIVVHPKLYLRVDGKLQRVPPGTEVTVTKAQAESLGKKLADPADAKRLKDGELTSGDEGGNAEQLEAAQGEITMLTEQLEAAQGEAEGAKAETAKANEALTETATKLAASQEEVKKLKKAAT